MTAAAVLAAAVLAYGLFTGGEDDVTLTQDARDRGYYVTRATLTEFGADGAPRIVLHADSIEQSLDDQDIVLSKLTLDYAAPTAGQWQVTSDRGRMPPNASALLLSGDVRVTGEQARGTAVIRTEQLAYDTVTSVIQTAEPVSVQFGTHRLDGRGLRVVLNDGTLRLESNVHGRFVP